MSAASVAVVVTSGERHEGKAGMVFLQVKLCDPCLRALYVPWCKKALYKYSSFPFSGLYFNSRPSDRLFSGSMQPQAEQRRTTICLAYVRHARAV